LGDFNKIIEMNPKDAKATRNGDLAKSILESGKK